MPAKQTAIVASDDFAATCREFLVRDFKPLTAERSGSVEDDVAEALVRACEKASLGLVISPLHPWVRHVAKNLTRNRLRKDRRTPGVLAQLAVASVGPQSESDGVIVSMDVRRALARLPEEQRRAVVLHHCLDLAVADVAAILGASTPKTRTLIHRGRRRLASNLSNLRTVTVT